MIPRYFQWIDAAPGVAAFAVVIFHYHHFYLTDHLARPSIPDTSTFPFAGMLWPFLEYGNWAVELFWMISGFVFSHVYLDKQTTLWKFSVARFARLYPLHFATLVYMALLQIASAAWVGHWQIYGNNDARHFLLQTTFLSNSVTLSRGLSFNGPIWSVSLEIVAYALFFLTLPVLRRSPRLFPLFACLAFFALGESGLDFPALRLGVFTCVGYFFVGTCLYGACRQLKWRPIAMVFLGLGLFTLGFGAMQWGATIVAAIFLGAGTIALLALGDRIRPATGAAFEMLGNISYSIYLVHVPLQASVLLLADLIWEDSRWFAGSWWLLPCYLAASTVLAIAAHRWFEKPVGRYLRTRLTPTVTQSRHT